MTTIASRPYAVPAELWVVLALLGALAVVMLIGAIGILSDVAAAIDALPAFGLALLLTALMEAAFGAGCLYLAYRLYLADRVARGITYVLAGSIALALVSDAATGGAVIAAIASVGTILVLALSPAVEAHFAGGPSRETPTVVVAQTMLMIWIVALAFLSLVYALFATQRPSLLILSLIFATIAAIARHYTLALPTGSATARLAVSCIVAIFVVVFGVFAAALATADEVGPGLIVPLGFAAGIAGALWLPNDARRHFAA